MILDFVLGNLQEFKMSLNYSQSDIDNLKK